MVACKAALSGATSSLKQYEVTKQETTVKQLEISVALWRCKKNTKIFIFF